jgi:hypothetical protein
MPPSSALSLPVSAAPARQLSRANRPRKRKSTAAELLFCTFAAFANLQHKTDGSYVNRPFLCSKQDVRETAFPPKTPSPAMSFVSFLQEKKTYPLPFLSRKKRKQKKVICGTVALRCCCLFREHATQNGRFTYEPSVFRSKQDVRESAFSPKDPSPPQCLLFLFFKKRKRSPYKKTYPFQEKKTSPFKRRKPSPLSRSAPRRSAADRPRRNTRS